MPKKILGLPLKSKAAVKAATPKKVRALVLPGCKSCSQELTKIDFNSREGNLYVHVCDHPDCDLYRRFQGHEGDIPEGLNLVEV